MSTAMTTKAANRYAEKIIWKIKVPAGTKGASIESFNIEREGEAEFLILKNSFLTVRNIEYDYKNKRWILDGILSQPFIIDNVNNNVKIGVGV